MLGLEYISQAQDWLKENPLRDIQFNYRDDEKDFLIILSEGEKVITATTGNNLANAVKNISPNFKPKG